MAFGIHSRGKAKVSQQDVAAGRAMLKTCGSAFGTGREGRTFPNDPVMVTE